MYRIIDTHCHLDIVQEQGLEIEDAVKIASEAGVTDIIQIGTDWESSLKAMAISQTFSLPKLKIHFAAGLHPTDIKSLEDFQPLAEMIQENVSNHSLVAIGEIGVDLYHDTKNFTMQEKILNQFLELASRLHLPVVIHSRDAAEETYQLLKNFKDKVFGVIHCYTYDFAYAKKFIDLGYYISFSGILAFKNATSIQDAASKIPLDTILIETDAPFLAPPPNRGKRNDSSNMPFILEKLFSLREEDKNTVEKSVYKNSIKFINRKAYHA